jgi:hypothetical protein
VCVWVCVCGVCVWVWVWPLAILLLLVDSGISNARNTETFKTHMTAKP